MKRKTVISLLSFCLIGVVGWFGLGLVSRAGYETAAYSVEQSDGEFEIRRYPDLTVVSTTSSSDLPGSGGGFMRLFRYISGQNEQNQKVAMTTPVFMDQSPASSGDAEAGGEKVGPTDRGRMAFVLPRAVAAQGAPDPSAEGVTLRTRKAGRFAVVRFAGKLSAETASKQESRLRQWMQTLGLRGQGPAEYAGYDPPMTPSALRRNEVLLRLDEAAAAPPSVSEPPSIADSE